MRTAPDAAIPPRRLQADPQSGRPAAWLIEGPSRTPDDRFATIWHRLRATLLEAPEAPALLCGEASLTRGQLREQAESWAALLPQGRIGVHLPRGAASVLLSLAIWCRDGVFVPIATEQPPARVQAITQSCGLAAVLADRELDLPGYAVADTPPHFPAVLHVRCAPAAATPEVPGLCLIVHTSGSTGTPKGVLISHANLLNRIACLMELLEVRANDRILHKTPALFDVHVWEFVLPIAAGCVLVVFPQQPLFDLREIASCLLEARITVAGFVPALLRLLLDMPGVAAGTALRTVFCGGEAWSPSLARTFHERLPGCRLFNSYGPAETTLAVANWPVPNTPGLVTICLGSPMPNILFLVEDTDGENVGEGALCIGGAQTALGIVGEDASSSRFFERRIGNALHRFYATGDHVNLDPATGTLTFRGRQDNQVKLNGIRIELAEVEAAIASIDTVEDCIAFMARRGGDSVLCAAYRTRGNVPLAPAVLKRACARLLPASSIPARLMQLDHLPLTASGKHDRAALALAAMPACDGGTQGAAAGIFPPAGNQDGLRRSGVS